MRNQLTLKRYKKEKLLHLMLIPGILITLIYSYGPMFGIIMAFQKFNPVKGFIESKWVGLKNFKYIFAMPDFYNVLWNSFYISFLKIIFSITIPLVLALLVNEVNKKWFKKVVQTSIFIPFFLSWTVLGGVLIEVFSLRGPINYILVQFGIDPIMFMASNDWFPGIIVASDVWKNMGYNMIIFLAAITNINLSLYEAAEVDGAGKWKQVLNITIPGIFPIIILICTLSIGSILNAGFEQILILYNPVVYQSGDIIDTFVYRMGIFDQQYSPAAAVGLFKSFVSMFMVSMSYFLAYKFSDYKIF